MTNFTIILTILTLTPIFTWIGSDSFYAFTAKLFHHKKD